ncbi:arylsulfatase J [Caerostris extrusa]|uniref:Arylsulfatase J n=1 Tax=Caerostris extrusa TaxID=172846 RepID=A0AAV4T318_CAEEX|nr:arylsulfatase J [Caerostris extrusa]
MLSNSIVVFSSDNGGESLPKYGGYSTNYPLRGKKMQVWEGGIRIPAFIWSPLLHLQEPRVSMQLMHLTDWLPTLYSAAGGNVENLGDIDGQSLWEALLSNSSSPRQEILHNIDPVSNISAIRVGDMKLVTGNIESGEGTFYGKELLEDMEKPESMDEWVFRNGSIVKNLLIDMGLFLPTTPDTWRRNTEVQCNGDPETANGCDPSQAPCLYDIAVDPCEINNIADQHPQDVDLMLRRIKNYTEQAAEAQNQEIDLHGDPRCHGFAFVPWLDEEHLSNCPFQ